MSFEKNIFSQFSSWYKTILQLGIFIGFLITSYYFLSIGYFPANDPTNFITILLYEALLSFLALGSLGVVLFLAPYFWIKTVLGTVNTCDWIVGRNSLETICNIANKEHTKDKNISTRAYLRIFSIYVSITLSYVSVLCYFYWCKNLVSLYMLLIFSVVCFNICCFIFPSFLDKKYLDSIPHKIESQSNLAQISFWNIKANFINLVSTIIASIVSGLLLFLGTIFTYLLISPTTAIFKFILPVFITALSGMCLSIHEKYNSVKKSIFVTVMVIIISFIPFFIDDIEQSNMQKSSLGSFDATLEIDSIACQMLYKQNFSISCETQKLPISANNIHVLWRGSEYYLRFTDKGNKIHYLIIPANHVYGFSFKKKNDTDVKTTHHKDQS